MFTELGKLGVRWFELAGVTRLDGRTSDAYQAGARRPIVRDHRRAALPAPARLHPAGQRSGNSCGKSDRRRLRGRHARGRLGGRPADRALWHQAKRRHHRRKKEQLRGYHELQQLLRVWYGERRPGALRRTAEDESVEGKDGRALRQARRVPPRGFDQALRTRRTGLPLAVRRGLVHGHSVGRHSPQQHSQTRRTHGQGHIRRVHDAPATVGDAGTERGQPALALRRRPATWTRRCTR